MAPSSISVPLALALIVFSFNQGVIFCDGEEVSEESTSDPMESSQQHETEHPTPSGDPAASAGESLQYEATPPAEEGNPAGDPMATASSEDQPEISNDQNWSNGEDHQPPTMSSGDRTSGDGGGTTISYDYVIPSEEPDKFGEELLATCKAESNYQGDFSDPNESSRELKCFYACALVRMDVMIEQDGQINFSEQVADDLVADALGENAEMIEKYKSAITACNEEVPKGGDRCEYAYAFITCGIQKLSG